MRIWMRSTSSDGRQVTSRPVSPRVTHLQKSKVKKLPQGVEPVSTILRGLEISLRTNSLRFDWFRSCTSIFVLLSWINIIVAGCKSLSTSSCRCLPRKKRNPMTQPKQNTAVGWIFSWTTSSTWTTKEGEPFVVVLSPAMPACSLQHS